MSASELVIPWGGACDLTLRDWLAGQALTGILPNATAGTAQDIPRLIEEVARQSYAVADAMLKQREKHE